jgi:4-alpha-glucanotransferase
VAAFARAHPRLIRFYQWVLWQTDRQAEAAQRRAAELGMPVGVYHDVALAVDRCGADMWAYRRFFVQGCRVGSPPDDFAPEGQDWSFPPPNLEAHREDGYRLFTESIRRNARHGGALRLDHVMRFFRLFCIPDELQARDGAYIRQTWEDFIRILALESQRGRFLVVGEDLGTVPPGMRETLERFRVYSYRLFYFERGPGGALLPPERYPLHALVSSTTHDLPTLAGFWAGRDLETRHACGLLEDPAMLLRQKEDRQRDKQRMLEALHQAGLLPKGVGPEAACWDELTGEIHNAIIGYLVSTPSQLMVLNQEDLTKEIDQQNVPGATWQYPNWRRKMRFTLEELESRAGARDFARMFRAWLEKTGRLSTPHP